MTKTGVAAGSMPAWPVAGVTDTMNSSWSGDPAGSEIARFAYSYWEARLRDGQAGSAEDDWFRAERELTRRMEAGSAAA